MQEQELQPYSPPQAPAVPTPHMSYSVRDCVAMGFRHVRLMILTFILLSLCAGVGVWLMPKRYDAHMKILVKQERLDPLDSPGRNAETPRPDPMMTEIDMNSEVELLKSDDLLEKVVVEAGLQSLAKESFLRSQLARLTSKPKLSNSGQDPRVLQAVRDLDKDLKVEALRRTKIIQVTYGSTDPQLSAKVLQILLRLYLQKHLDVHRTPGAIDFFESQTDEYRKSLTNAEQKLLNFGNTKGVVAPPLEKEIAVRNLNQFEAEQDHTLSAIAETEQRIKVLEQQAAATPSRLTTQVRTSLNGNVLAQIQNTLMTLELKRTELLTKFTPDYPLVQEVDTQIAQANDALAKAKANPMLEETTDRDTNFEWIRGELAKARADLTALQARSRASSAAVDKYREQALHLNQKEIVQQDINRDAKTAEENFLLYKRKLEEARISDALDKQRMVNVSVAEEASVPGFSSGPSRSLMLLLGFMLAGTVSVAVAVIRDQIDRSFRTPHEVEVLLSVPVLASFPRG
jgi:uncharacterized protein involved in exopolysaccharide biosynthesis